MMRCQVLIAKDPNMAFGSQNLPPTDIEVWNEANAYRTAVSSPSKRDPTNTQKGAQKPPTEPPSTFKLSDILGGRKKAANGPKIVRRKQTTSKDHTHTCDSEKCPSHKSSNEGAQADGKNRNKSSNTNENEDPEEEANSKESNKEAENGKNSSFENLLDSSLPPLDQKQKKLSELQRLKANCKPEEIQSLKNKCEQVVRNCVGSLLVKLSQDDFRNLEG
jgi:hypothetical protein